MISTYQSLTFAAYLSAGSLTGIGAVTGGIYCRNIWKDIYGVDYNPSWLAATLGAISFLLFNRVVE